MDTNISKPSASCQNYCLIVIAQKEYFTSKATGLFVLSRMKSTIFLHWKKWISYYFTTCKGLFKVTYQ